jgi:hypothetical protein
MSPANQQLALKPQDIVVLLKLCLTKAPLTYANLANEIFLSASEVHSSFKRIAAARLISQTDPRDVQVVRSPFRDFLYYGVPFAFPAVRGSMTRGMPTAYAIPFIREQIATSDEPPPVWPYANGSVRGIALYPLYPTAPRAAEKDQQLYLALALVDAIRIGGAREREISMQALAKILS